LPSANELGVDETEGLLVVAVDSFEAELPIVVDTLWIEMLEWIA